MQDTKATTANARSVEDVVLMLRGLLADASGSEDDPFLRLVLTPAGNASGPAPLVVDDAGWNLPDKELRESLKRSIDEYVKTRGSKPTSITLRNNAYAVSSDPEKPGHPLSNKVALVTGAAGAIGAGICRGLLDNGCRVAATDLSRDRLDDLVKELGTGMSGRVIGVAMDVTDPASVSAAFGATVAAWGGVDIVVVNAGIAAVGLLVDMDIETFRKAEKVNVEGALLTVAEAGRRLCRQLTACLHILLAHLQHGLLAEWWPLQAPWDQLLHSNHHTQWKSRWQSRGGQSLLWQHSS